MRSRSHLVRALSVMWRGGALGASLVLGLTATQAAAQPNPASVAERLRAIRVAVDEISNSPPAAGSAEPADQNGAGAAPAWWGNGGWGRWHYGWGNGGWGWHNWPNGWHNWGNGWNNWGNGGWGNGWHNGWHNFWHNW